jgi:hypothetical protein
LSRTSLPAGESFLPAGKLGQLSRLSAAGGSAPLFLGWTLLMDELDRLVAIEAITQLKARYCRFVDTQQWVEFRALFTDDAHFEFGDYVPESPDAFLEGARSTFEGAVSMHHCHSPEIEMTAHDEAVGTWAMEDRIVWNGERPPHHGYGHYEERYTKRGDAWFISAVRLTYIRLEVG